MGLTIHYELSVSENLKVAVVRELVQCVARYAEKIGCAEVGQVQSAAGDHQNAGLFVHAGRPEDCCFGIVPPKHGWVVEVWPGEGCAGSVPQRQEPRQSHPVMKMKKSKAKSNRNDRAHHRPRPLRGETLPRFLPLG